MSSAPPQPRTGDVVIARQCLPAETAVYIVAHLNGPPQLLYDTREKAVKEMRACARALHIDVWESQEGGLLTRIVQCRLDVSVPLAPSRLAARTAIA